MEINKSEAKELDYLELWIGTTITRQGVLWPGIIKPIESRLAEIQFHFIVIIIIRWQ